MSFCPTKDIHSIYLDNELPEVYKAEYEKHLTQCAKCRADLAELQAVRELIQADVKKITPNENFMEESYERLMIKMSYNKNSVKANKKSPFVKISYFVSAAAAAVMLALFIPVGLNARKNTVGPIAPEFASNSVNNMAAMAVQENTFTMPNFGNNISFGSGNDGLVSGNMKDVLASYKNEYENAFFEQVKGIDILRPEFPEDNIISIRITIPSVGDIPVETDLGTIGLVISGNYEWNLLEN